MVFSSEAAKRAAEARWSKPRLEAWEIGLVKITEKLQERPGGDWWLQQVKKLEAFLRS